MNNIDDFDSLVVEVGSESRSDWHINLFPPLRWVKRRREFGRRHLLAEPPRTRSSGEEGDYPSQGGCRQLSEGRGTNEVSLSLVLLSVFVSVRTGDQGPGTDT